MILTSFIRVCWAGRGQVQEEKASTDPHVLPKPPRSSQVLSDASAYLKEKSM